MSPKTRKLVFMSFLSVCASKACYWQYNRYHESKHRWEIIHNEIQNNNPT